MLGFTLTCAVLLQWKQHISNAKSNAEAFYHSLLTLLTFKKAHAVILSKIMSKNVLTHFQ